MTTYDELFAYYAREKLPRMWTNVKIFCWNKIFVAIDYLGKEGLEIIRAAVEHGVTLFDTAEAYGPFTNENWWELLSYSQILVHAGEECLNGDQSFHLKH